MVPVVEPELLDDVPVVPVVLVVPIVPVLPLLDDVPVVELPEQMQLPVFESQLKP